MESVLIFPHQLFEKHPGLKKGRHIFLIEDPRFFSEFRFHQKKLIFHRASLKNFEKLLNQKGYKTHYVEGDLESQLKLMRFSTLHVAELDDIRLEKKLAALAKRLKIKLEVVRSPGFMTSASEFQILFKGKKRFSFERFYIFQRKKFDLLLNEKGKPKGGKWSLDQENRKRLPNSLKIPQALKFSKTKEVQEAISYIKKKYPANPGSSDFFNYPTTHAQAKKALKNFLEKRLNFFGDYEDAIAQKEQILFHSCLSPLLNAGLLTPDQVIAETMRYCLKHEVRLNSLEGFVRQVIGWREFVRGVYGAIGEKQRIQNFFNHARKLPKSFYDGTTGIVPIDATIKKLEKHAYLHHIERLMLLGNFFLLCEFDPNEIYRWFMEFFIDAYDWVMVPNVYGMSQYADGGMMTTKPYFSGSNYILKMSDYPKGQWCEIWDALFWRFMIKHIKFFEKQPRLRVLCLTAKKKKRDHALLKVAEAFLERLN
ncbi:MAG: cryptochrome/photolyase family protein [Verrucomicrobia bacterium]|nr:cryptochrome/photolyase family protein [Verrucomicrobiota bacterium]